jgi:ribosome maturation factor RimP
VTLRLKRPLAGQWRQVGTLTDVTDDSVTLEVDEPPPPRTVTLTHDMIGEAKRVVTW